MSQVQTEAESRIYFGRQLVEHSSVVGFSGERLVGFAVFGTAWLYHLYVSPDHQGLGMGSALVAHVKARCGGTLQSWVHVANDRALSFCARHGFESAERSPRDDSEDRLPEQRMVWRRAFG